MDNRYLLACECGRQLTIDPGQAGQVLTCACGKKVQAPGTLQELRKLPRPKVEEEAVPASNWNASSRFVFAFGSLLVLFGLIMAGYFGYFLWHVGDTKKPDESQFSFNMDIDTLTPIGLMEIWEKAGHELPKDRPMPDYLYFREVSGRLFFLVSIGAGVAVIGLIACVAASWMAQRKS